MTERDQDFIDWFKREFGQELTQQQAIEKRLALLGMMRIVYTPISEQQFSEVQQWRKERLLKNKKYEQNKTN